MNIRPATPADADTIARQRGQMLLDMGSLTPEQVAAEQGVWAAWLAVALATGEYAGLLAEEAGEVIGGVGIVFYPKLPSTADPSTRKGHLLNVSVDPAHRRKGYAAALVQAALDHLAACGVVSVTLAPMGRRIYERLGFVEAANPELRLTLDR